MADDDINSATIITNAAPNDDSRRTSLRDLSAQATGAYGRKDFGKAAELYSEAVELQAELNGEMLPANAELLYSYGRCLYKIGVSQSDVLGNRVAGDNSTNRKKKRKAGTTPLSGEKEATIGSKPTDQAASLERRIGEEKKPYFELQGDDDDWDDSDDQEDGDDGDKSQGKNGAGEEEEEDDELATAYEVLDLARVLLNRKLDATRAVGDDKNQHHKDQPEIQQSLEKLADIHDLQAEISLENENFPLAVADSREALAILKHLFPLHNRLVAEAHFKLSLALEFASVTQVKPESGQQQEVAQVDEAMRAEAASHTAKTIESCKLRKALEEKALETLSGDEAEEKRKQIKDVAEMLDEFEQRLLDLRAPTVPMVADPAAIFAGAFNDAGSAAKREEKAAMAQDISNLVKHKKKTSNISPNTALTEGKRKADEAAEVPSEKKIRIEQFEV